MDYECTAVHRTFACGLSKSDSESDTSSSSRWYMTCVLLRFEYLPDAKVSGEAAMSDIADRWKVVECSLVTGLADAIGR